jgi:cytoskeleton protein RodZ
MEKETFGSVLREAREHRRISLNEISRKTKVPEPALAQIETGSLTGLPADVFVRGFIRSYARFVGISDVEPLGLYQRALDDKRRAQEALVAQPKPPLERGEMTEEDGPAPRRGIGLAVFVIIVLLIATITWSIFLRQTPQSGEGLSLRVQDPAAAEARLQPAQALPPTRC